MCCPSGRRSVPKGGMELSASNLRPVEKKVLGAMLILTDSEMVVNASMAKLATTMGYKQPGGALTNAIQALEMKNFITSENGKYKVLL